MLIASKLQLAIAAGLMAGPVGARGLTRETRNTSDDVVEIAPANFSYRLGGDFSRAGRPAGGPLRATKFPQRLSIMRHQVTAAEYSRCIDAGACPKVAVSAGGEDRPVVGVNW